MAMGRGTKRGSVLVEASIFLPIFLIAILSLGYLIKAMGTDEAVMAAMSDELKRASGRAYTAELGLLLPVDTKQRVSNEVPEAENFHITGFLYLYGDITQDISDLILIRGDYKVGKKLPMGMTGGFDRNITLIARGFNGRDKPRLVNGEDDSSKETVYVFPRAGEKYHDENCPYIKVCARETTLNNKIKEDYKPCRFCRPETLPAGSKVYYFPASGEVYHRESCSMVTRYVIPMEKWEAQAEGYTPCSKCQGSKDP